MSDSKRFSRQLSNNSEPSSPADNRGERRYGGSSTRPAATLGLRSMRNLEKNDKKVSKYDSFTI